MGRRPRRRPLRPSRSPRRTSSTPSATRWRRSRPSRRSPSRSSRRSRSASPTFARRARRSGPTRRSRRRATSSPSKLTYIPQQQLLVSYHRVVRSHNQVYVSVQPSHAAQICSSKQTYHYRSQQYELEGPSSFARENWISWCCESVCRRRLGQRPCGYRFGIAPRALNLRISLACCGESLMCGRREEWHSGVREESEGLRQLRACQNLRKILIGSLGFEVEIVLAVHE